MLFEEGKMYIKYNAIQIQVFKPLYFHLQVLLSRQERTFEQLDMTLESVLGGSRKYPYPHHGGNWKFRGGEGVKDPGNSGGEGGWMIDFVSRCPSIQYSFK